MEDLVRKVNTLRREHKELTDLRIRSEEQISSADRETNYILSEIKEKCDLEVKNLNEAEYELNQVEDNLRSKANEMEELLRKIGRNI